MSDTPRFDLVDIAKVIQRKARFILLVALAGAIVGAAFYLIGTRKYKAASAFLVANPLYSDRNNIFRNDKTSFVDYYGREDDVDKLLAVAKADGTRDSIINAAHLIARYGTDTTKKKWRKDVESRFERSFDVKRTEYQTVEVSYTDADPKLATLLTNECVDIINRVYSGYYNALRTQNRQTLEARLKEIDSSLVSMTDTLAAMRDKYGIYEVISPARMNSATSSSHSGGPGYGRAFEEVQSMEATKDQLVIDRSRYVSLINEFSTGMHAGDQPQIQVISPAIEPTQPRGLNLLLTIIACAAVAALFATLWVLITTYYRILTSVSR